MGSQLGWSRWSIGRVSDADSAGFGREADSGPVERNVGPDELLEQIEDLTIVRVATRRLLRIQDRAVDDELECSSGARHEAKILDHVLVVGQEIIDRAHGAG